MFDSTAYWIQRYQNNGNSGLGSYGENAKIKAEVINNFIKNNGIKSLVDYGVGDGNQLKLLDTSDIAYTGIDVSETVILKCKETFKNDKMKTFILAKDINKLQTELVLSMDVIYHLIEDVKYMEYLKNIFSMSQKYVIIYAPNCSSPDPGIHVKKREFIPYIFENYKMFNLVNRTKLHIGCPFYIFQKTNTYTPSISKNILQISLKPLPKTIVNETRKMFVGYDYFWFNDEKMYEYIQNNQLEEFPNLVKHIKSFRRGQHKSDIFRYYWLYLNGGVYIDDDCITERSIDFMDNTFVSVKSYHTNQETLFNGFIACSPFNPIIYKALLETYSTPTSSMHNDYHLFCKQIYYIYLKNYKYQKTFLMQEKKTDFKDGVKTFHNGEHILTHYCYNKNFIKTIK
jgi:hypothetical protein